MNENIKSFLEKVRNDEELKARLAVLKDPEELYALAKSVQEGFTKEEFFAAIEKMKAQKKAGAELTDEDMDTAAGGAGGFDTIQQGIDELGIYLNIRW